MIEPDLVDSMVEYVTMATLMLHRDVVAYTHRQKLGEWRPLRIVPAHERRIGVLGLGMLGEACSRKLAGFGFEVAGWSRSRRSIDGVSCFSGDGELGEFLSRTDILI